MSDVHSKHWKCTCEDNVVWSNTRHKKEKENAHRAAGNLLISANYFGGLERFCVSASEIKDGGGYVFLSLLLPLLLSQILIRTVIIGPRGLSTQVALSLIPT